MPDIPDDEPRLNVLIAFPYVTPSRLKAIRRERNVIRWLLDSGAFTAWKAGRQIKLDAYCRFLEGLPVEPWRYFTLDVIGDARGTMANYEALLKRGFRPIPIFTRGEDPSVIDDYYRTSEVVGVGGLVGTRGNRGFVNGIMRKVGRRRVHWLGFTDLAFVKHYRPYSCDSSSSMTATRYGSLSLYMGAGRSRMIRRTDFAACPSAEVLRAISSYGFDPPSLGHEEEWRGGYSVADRLAFHSSVRLALDVQRHLGVLMFTAIGTDNGMHGQLFKMLDGFYYETQGERPYARDPRAYARRSRREVSA